MRLKPLLFHFSAEFVASSTIGQNRTFGFLRVDTETRVRSGCPDFEMIDLAAVIRIRLSPMWARARFRKLVSFLNPRIVSLGESKVPENPYIYVRLDLCPEIVATASLVGGAR